jgi:hypothetical protein
MLNSMMTHCLRFSVIKQHDVSVLLPTGYEGPFILEVTLDYISNITLKVYKKL